MKNAAQIQDFCFRLQAISYHILHHVFFFTECSQLSHRTSKFTNALNESFQKMFFLVLRLHCSLKKSPLSVLSSSYQQFFLANFLLDCGPLRKRKKIAASLFFFLVPDLLFILVPLLCSV